ncbi:alanine dehydrogenase [Myroides ceti]|uniref:alanine dehydrogenase n=1 Tax=Paenimyroides ceti TaxID=395087 RepID=A0ABT8CSM1_9FLAO|nr:alanine dehydrogenase [Paenimyroides ceti]MDN3707507.1 alanine dehydrogenase [Paenimyroides ceti]
MGITTPFSKRELMPQEEKLDIRKKRGKLFIGIPKENFKIEQRICLTPEAVNMLVTYGHKVLIESGAGTHASYTDKEYSEAGAQITQDPKKVFSCPIILKVEPPTLEEIALMKAKTYLFSAIQLKTQKKEYFQALAKKKITALCYEFIKDREGAYPFLQAISEIAGIASIHIAAEYMTKCNDGKGLLFGNITGVPPTEVVIIGAGTVAEFAARTALGLGANVKVFDNSIHKLKNLQRVLPYRIFTSTIQEKVLLKSLMRCDVAIGAIRGASRSPIIVSETMVERMKGGAVVIDVCIDNGGCFETSEATTHENPIKTKYNVVHYGVPNITSRYSKTATLAISNIISPYLLELSENGGLENALEYDKAIRSGVYMYQGILVNQQIGEWYGLDYKDINLFVL